MTFILSDAIAILERTPSSLRALLINLPEAWTTANEGPNTFSAFDNVGHLLHGERTDWMPRARIILAQDANRKFEPFDRFAQNRASEGKSLNNLLDEFATARAENIKELRSWNVSDDDLKLEGEHPEFGIVTLRQLMATWTVHDLGHLAQIERVMAKLYREEVGPWRAYLPILDR